MAPADRARLFPLLGWTVVVATALGFFGGIWWVFDLFAHFRAHLLVGAATLALLQAWVGASRELTVLLAAVVINAATLLPQLVAGSTPTGTSDVHSLLLANVLTSNDDPGRLLDYVVDSTPDVVVLLEVDERWWEALEPLRRRYPHQVARLRPDNFGIAMLSRLELRDAEVFSLGHDVPMLRAHATTGNGEVQIVAAHPLPPVGSHYASRRDAQLLELAEELAVRDVPATLVVGDLNATPWSWPFRRLVARTGLRDASRGHTLRPTWPSRLGWLGIPIDQVLHGPGVEIVDEVVGPDIGSDHRPVQVWFRQPAR